MLVEKGHFKLILKSKDFLIPSDFNYINNVRKDIFISLFTKQQYKVKSYVNEGVFQSFINHWILKETPNINSSNYNDYLLLSEEFDRMKDLIKIYKAHNKNKDTLYLNKKNRRLKTAIDKHIDDLNETRSNYQQIIHLLFNKNVIDSSSEFLNIKSELLNSCKKGNVKMVDLLTRKKVNINGLSFVLNEEEMTAGVFRNINAEGNIFIPYSIQYESHEFIVTDIFENAFKNSSIIKSIQFPENSQIITIEKNAFANSSLERISIPQQVTVIFEGCFNCCFNLQKVDFPFQSKLRLIEKEAFSRTAINSIVIPLHVKEIGEAAFNYCIQLRQIEFVNNCELNSIDKYAFIGSSLESITIQTNVSELKKGWCSGVAQLNKFDVMPYNRFFTNYSNRFIFGKSNAENVNYDILLFARRNMTRAVIPSFIKRIASHAFDECLQLKVIDFSENSQLVSIDKYAFVNSSLETISIPANVSELKDSWCAGTLHLKNVSIAPDNLHFMYVNNSVIIGKSDPKSDDYDTLHFARRDISKLVVPSFIKYISPYAFNQCHQLQAVEFPSQSQITSIGKHAFSFTSLRQISIPARVKHIDKYAFFMCNQLRNVTFQDNSELKSIGKFSFSKTSIENISIPSSVVRIEESAFFSCSQLKRVDFQLDSELNTIEKNAFSSFSLEEITIPSKLTKIKGWLCPSKKLDKINVMSNNENYTYYDNSFILGKSNLNSDIFDVLVFSRRNIEHATIPPFIRQIAPFAFAACQQLQRIDFYECFELNSIKECAFLNTSLKSISIPLSVTQIEEEAFANCHKLQVIEIAENSKLISFDSNIYNNSSLSLIMIPPKLIKIFNNS